MIESLIVREQDVKEEKSDLSIGNIISEIQDRTKVRLCMSTVSSRCSINVRVSWVIIQHESKDSNAMF